jgi:hypothetical protein
MTDDQADKMALEWAPHMAKIAKLFNELGLTKPIGFAVLLCYAGLVMKEMVPELEEHQHCTHSLLDREAGRFVAHTLTQAGPQATVQCLMVLATQIPRTLNKVRTLIEAERVCRSVADGN